MANWNAIKTEYITTDTSYRKLAEKYGLDQATIARRAKKEDWVSKRQQNAIRTQAKIVNAISNKQVDRAANLISVSDLLLSKVKNLLETDAEVLGDTQAMKHISGVLKDIKEIQMIRSDADMREQEARIKNLQKQAERDEVKDTGYHGVVLLPVVADMPAPPKEDNDG